MKEELNQIVKNDTWELVSRPIDKNVIGMKWVFRNKMNEQDEFVRNKARLVWKVYLQQEGINYVEIYFPIAIMEVVKIFLPYATNKKF